MRHNFVVVVFIKTQNMVYYAKQKPLYYVSHNTMQKLAQMPIFLDFLAILWYNIYV